MGTPTIETLRQQVRGPVVTPGDEAYEDARQVYNAMIDRRPDVVVRAADVADVRSAVDFARTHELDLSVRGGGHGVAGFATNDGGLVVDLGSMRGIRVDPRARTARAEGGCTWGDFDHATHAFGLATTGGVVSTTGIAGLTLGGGMGNLTRRCGLSCDNLVSADVVTADGGFLTCSETEHSDLFWALRGGGGNFGVVTSFEYRLHPVADITGGPTFYPPDAEVLAAYQEFLGQAPEELGLIGSLVLAPPLPFVPEEWHGQPVAGVLACWTGSPEEGDKVLAGLRELGPVVGQGISRMPYPVVNTLFDELLPRGLYHYWKGTFARELSPDAIKAHVEHGRRVPTFESGMFLFPIDGACHRVASDQTAFSYRDARFSVVIDGTWTDPADNARHTAWVREYHDAIRPHSELGGYVNFMDADDLDRVQLNYRGNYERLAAVKAKYDPTNLFHLNQNIVPAA